MERERERERAGRGVAVLIQPSPAATRQTRSQRLPADWQPEPLDPGSVAGRAVAHWSPGELERELSRFRDHWAAASGSNARKHDWQATWRNWLIRADEGGTHGKAYRGAGSRHSDGFARALDRSIAGSYGIPP